MDCVLMETSAYKEMQAHLQRLLERVSALHSLSAQPTTVRWLTAEEVCKALSIPNELCNTIALPASSPIRPWGIKYCSGTTTSGNFWKRT